MNIFNTVKVQKPNFSTFDLSYDVKLSLKMGKLVPVHCQEALPGDRFRMSSEAMFRMMPMIAPIMHKVDIFFHSFFVPNRILWKNWETFITGGQPSDPVPALPVIDHGNVDPSTLGNYLGLPVVTNAQPFDVTVSALPFAAYHRIWHEYYRDQNLQLDAKIDLQDGAQTAGDTALLKVLRDRAWEHDYFTSALPFAQKGAPVELPIDFANAQIIGQQPGVGGAAQPQIFNSATGTPLAGGGPTSISSNAAPNAGQIGITDFTGAGFTPGYIEPNGSLKIQGTAGATINDLRSSYALQRWLEKNARGGSRYFESNKIHFSVVSPDARLDRPEYLGGSKANMAISEVLQTSATDQAVSAQGNMAGHGISLSSGQDYSYKCQEHGYIITILSIRPKTAYYAGVPRHFMKTDKMDYYWPDFAMLGEQPILSGEVMWQTNLFPGGPSNYDTWGYIPRYSEYRFNHSRVAGQMATSLEYWHMGRKFDPLQALPPLDAKFIVCDPTKRIFAVTNPTDDEIVAHVYHKISAQRPLPTYGTPGIF